MFDSRKMIGYQAGDSFLHRLSGTSKLLFFLLVSIAAMTSYDTRLLLAIALGSLALFTLSGIKFKQVSIVILLASFFALLNVVMIYLFAPNYGVGLYQSKQILLEGWGAYSITSQELFYLGNVLLKYICTIPLALIFLLTTHPSQFAASLNQIGLSYKVAYSVSLTLRYIPDLQEEFYMIKMSQEARGLELSKKAKLSQRIKGNLQIITPLIFSSLDRIETIATAMELRRFGKHKKRTWYTAQKFGRADQLVTLLGFAVLLIALTLFFINGSRFYNPWK
ncbi:energy-coupling factor transporter transmembrane component T family protein [Streptococcus massiliensis]|uniref:Cobalt transport family protein n=1 Tax=Streptococcus massiliensis TaxID=313439 RepID=A0A380KZ92_9STRE|nr:energy-coupling factor transporter transmembrane component T [Streptococcus massiliensis]SUN77314.1 cobalt transport family protein [Streptococcus massiliensis]